MNDYYTNNETKKKVITRKRLIIAIAVIIWLLIAVLLGYLTRNTSDDVMDVPESFDLFTDYVKKPQLTDRFGVPITVTYLNHWNSSSCIPLHEVPEILKQIIVLSEDKRFFFHGGVDWTARFHALYQNISSMKAVRGASTITEQVVRMIHPRPRTFWSRWIEGFEAVGLEEKYSKDAILEFYLNQVPYASNRRGIVQASEYYFNRAPDTLSIREMIALAVLVRAPSSYDLYRHPGVVDGPVLRLAETLYSESVISKDELHQVKEERFDLQRPGLSVDAAHFAGYVYSTLSGSIHAGRSKYKTTLDGPLQANVQKILRQSLEDLSRHNVMNGACLVSDHQTGHILAWVSEGIGDKSISGSQINSVIVPRQPGSSLKPFLYALALEKGWTAATLIDDRPLTNPVGKGLHTYHNYSRLHYGPVSLRNALGNSLNIPAVRAIRHTGVDTYINRLRDLGITSLDRHPDFYGDGLALGNGEITLYELVQAYNTLANKGVYKPLSVIHREEGTMDRRRVFSGEITSIISNILADPEARGLEFGSGSLLNFPVQTAVKTGTSNDYRDSWAAGFNSRYTVAVWFGNLDGRATDGVTGATGPAMVLRSVFAELNKYGDTKPLYVSPRLERKDICIRTGDGEDGCVKRTEWFVPGTHAESLVQKEQKKRIGFLKPVNGLQMAMDPRIPDDNEAFEFVVAGVSGNDYVTWTLNGDTLGRTRGGNYVWPLQKGRHIVEATIFKTDKNKTLHDSVVFSVK